VKNVSVNVSDCMRVREREDGEFMRPGHVLQVHAEITHTQRVSESQIERVCVSRKESR
jgi:isocitrate/isopropylmalate dehydrogenase